MVLRLLDVYQALSLLTPWEINAPKVRAGGPNDGCYVMVDRFRVGQKAYSFGVGRNISLDLWLAERGIDVWQFDHTVEGPPARHPRCHFVREGIASISKPAQSLHSLTDYMQRFGHQDSDMILKIDIEGAEWRVLRDIPADELGRFEQVVIELHGLRSLSEPAFRHDFIAAISKLNAQFTLHHVHGVNFSRIDIVEGFPIPNVLEVSYIRSELVQRAPNRTVFPSALDMPGAARLPDQMLLFWPFLPLGVPQSAVDATVSRVGAEALGYASSVEARALRRRVLELEAELAACKPGHMATAAV